MALRIAEISTLFRPVPPNGEGSVESVVFQVVEGLIARGHRVTLFARADSRTSAALRSPVPDGLAGPTPKWDWQLYEAFQVREAFRAWRDFDLIHCHSYHHGLIMCDAVPIPSLHSIHVEPGPDILFLARRTTNRRLVFCSRHQARDFEGVPGVHVIPHGLDMSGYPPPQAPGGGYLAFLGRFIPEKGPLEAIAIAKKSGLPIELAGPANEYFDREVRPHLDPPRVSYAGELRGARKAEFLASAAALIYPVQRPEPFGLVLVEAMAAGLPVLALNRGAAPEIVEPEVTGVLAESEEDLVEACRRLDRFDRAAIRRRAMEKFSSARMVDELERLMIRSVEESKR
jgi:glycosyltransferase involved in cell wall biosynthesis